MAVTLRQGELNRLVTVKHTLLNTQDTFGQVPDTETTVKQVWAAIRSLSGSEQTFGNQVNGLVTHEIETHYDSTFAFDSISVDRGSSRMVIVYGTRKFYVDSVHDVDDAHVKMLWQVMEIRN